MKKNRDRFFLPKQNASKVPGSWFHSLNILNRKKSWYALYVTRQERMLSAIPMWTKSPPPAVPKTSGSTSKLFIRCFAASSRIPSCTLLLPWRSSSLWWMFFGFRKMPIAAGVKSWSCRVYASIHIFFFHNIHKQQTSFGLHCCTSIPQQHDFSQKHQIFVLSPSFKFLKSGEFCVLSIAKKTIFWKG